MNAPVREPISQSEHEDEASVDLHSILAAFRRRMKLFIAVGAFVLAAVVAFTLVQVPEYTADARVLIDQRKQEITKEESVLSGLPDDPSVVDTETQVMQSRAIAERVVKELNLENDDEFAPDLGPTLFQSAIKWVDPSAVAPRVVSPALLLQLTIDNVLANLDVERAQETFVIDINFTSEDAAKATRIANAFANAYLDDQFEAKLAATKQVTDWLNARLGNLKQESEQAASELQTYRAAHNLLSVSQDQSVEEQELSNLNAQKDTAEADLRQWEARLATAQEQMRRGSNGDDVTEALGSPVIQALREQRSQANQRYADVETKYGPRHPDLLRAKQDVDAVDEQINAEIQRVISNLSAEVAAARAKVASLDQSVRSAEARVAAAGNAGVQARALSANAEGTLTLYQTFVERMKETAAQEGMQLSDARIVSPASLPTSPSWPRKTLLLALGFVVALLFGSLAVGAAEAMDKGISAEEDVERELRIPALASIPTLASVVNKSDGARKSLPTDYIAQNPLSAFAESFRGLRASLLLSRAGRDVKLVAITSALPREGKTTTALCLARVSALAGSNTILVDCDTRHRGVSAFVEDGCSEYGLIDVLNGTATLQSAIVSDKASGACLLPLGKSPHTAKDIFGGAAMHAVLNELRGRFDLVILDTSPLLVVSDARSIVHQADAVVLLAQWRKTPRKAIEACLKALSLADAYLAGATLVQVDQRKQAKVNPMAARYYSAYKDYYAS